MVIVIVSKSKMLEGQVKMVFHTQLLSSSAGGARASNQPSWISIMICRMGSYISFMLMWLSKSNWKS